MRFAPNPAEDRGHEDFNIVGKLRPGVSLEQVRAEMDTITARLRQAHPEVYPPNGRLTFIVLPLLEQVVGNVRHTLWLLLAAVGCVLLIACANVANLMLSRALARQREIAVRTAVGATAGRIIRQLLTESVLLAVCGGGLGVIFAMVSVHWTAFLAQKRSPAQRRRHSRRRSSFHPADFRSCRNPVWPGAGLARCPRKLSFHAQRFRARLRRGQRHVGTRQQSAPAAGHRRACHLGGGADCGRTAAAQLCSAATCGSGFNPSNVLTLELTMTGDKYKDPQVVRSTYHQLWGRLERLPGAVSAGGVSLLPLSETGSWGPINVEGRVLPAGEKFINADERIVSGHYFEAMQIPLLKGRLFNDQDTADKPHVLVVDEYMAQQLWPNEDPLGKRISFGDLAAKPEWATVIGVVGRIKQVALDTDSRIALYMPEDQYNGRAMNIVLRSSTDPASMASAVNHELHELDRELPTYRVVTIDQRIAESLSRRRFTTILLTLFAGLALALAAVGIYGVMAYLVSQGTRELGIRMALGATPPAILRLVIRQGLVLALSGVGVGLIAAVAFGRLVSGLLFGVRSTDPVTFGAIALLLIAVALLASYIPARRAARIDPMISLRRE